MLLNQVKTPTDNVLAGGAHLSGCRHPLKRRPISRFINKGPQLHKRPFHKITGYVPTVAASDVAQTTEPGVENNKDPEEAFNWFKTWWPVNLVRNLENDRPNRIQLMGRWYVAWKGPSGNWNLMDDACPHRLAPLSEGRVEDDGTLLCAYHAWRFDEAGKCVKIPQADSEAAECTACDSRRSRVTKYPAKVVGGVLWLWPDASESSLEESEAYPIPMREDLAQRADKYADLGVPLGYTRILPYSCDVLLENLADPAHLPVAHHAAFPFFNRYNAKSLDMKPVDAKVGPHIKEEHNLGSWDCLINGLPSRVTVAAPNYTEQVQELKELSTFSATYSVPLEAGKCRVIFFQISPRSDKPPPLALKLFPWIPHLVTSTVFDSDTVFLNAQDRNLRVEAAKRGTDATGGNKGGWRKFFLPTSSDLAIRAIREWMDSKGNGGPSFPSGQAMEMSDLSRQELQDRYESHTKECKECQRGLKLAETVVAAAQLAMILSFGGLCALFGSIGVKGIVSKLSTALGGAGILAVMVAAFFARKAALELRQKFLFLDWVHADHD
ncbi:hypothetical protein BSKO_04660 [Bryopsis sp. KO-2023]|nr:hypothetical protein BSKO_04660 [Bryopsis sp. KO-2023]